MGQGHYACIGYGCVLEGTKNWRDDSAMWNPARDSPAVKQRLRAMERLERLLFADSGALAGIRLQMASEAEPNYLIIPLATTDLGAGTETSRLIRLPTRRALPLDDLVRFWMSAIPSEALAEARQEWERVQMDAAAAGIMLPEGRLIYVADWD